MMYFEKNLLKDLDAVDLHDQLLTASHVVANNILFNQTHEVSERHRWNLAGSALMMIAVCEAIVDTVPEEEAKAEFEDVRKTVSGDEKTDEAARLLAKILWL